MIMDINNHQLNKNIFIMIMKTKYILKLLFTTLVIISATSCSYNEPVIEELPVSREFAPIELTARVRSQTTVELNWTPNEIIETYEVQISENDPDFSNIIEIVEVTADQLPFQIRLEGETLYFVRVKSKSSRGIDDSSWAIEEALTLAEQIMLPSEPGDIKPLEATLRWEAGQNVTHFILQPGDIRHDITSQEKEDGVAVVTGLTSETEYFATLYNNTKIRGSQTFTTGIDIGDNTLVLPTDDLFQVIADAAPGDILLLEQGDYTAQVGSITIDKPLTIQGLRTDFKPLLKVSFSLITGATDVSLIDLDLTGDASADLTDMLRYTALGDFNSLLVSGCVVHDYERSFIAGNVTNAIVQSITVENCIVTNVLTSGGDFIDFRSSDVLNINLTTSTFNNCAPGRDFIRMDAAGVSNGNATSNILIDSCTLYACSNNSSRRVLYVRFETNEVTVRNTLISDTESEGYADRSGIDESPIFSSNNYFNAPGFYDTSQYIYDDGNYTLEDPGYVDASNGDFTITNQTLLDNAVGDPRWRP